MAITKTKKLERVCINYVYYEGQPTVKHMVYDWNITVDDDEDGELPMSSMLRGTIIEDDDRSDLDPELVAIAEAIWPEGSPE